MSENLNRAGIHAVLGAGSLILNDYALNITPIERGYRLAVTRGSEAQTMDIMDGAQGQKGDKGDKGDTGAQGEPGKDAPQDVVRYAAQSLVAEQQAQARENIAAAGVETVKELKGDMDCFENAVLSGSDVIRHEYQKLNYGVIHGASVSYHNPAQSTNTVFSPLYEPGPDLVIYFDDSVYKCIPVCFNDPNAKANYLGNWKGSPMSYPSSAYKYVSFEFRKLDDGNIDESELLNLCFIKRKTPNGFSRLTKYAYVSSRLGSDSNAGTEAAPFATITKAINDGYQNILVEDGVYAEKINLSGGRINIRKWSVEEVYAKTQPDRKKIELINGVEVTPTATGTEGVYSAPYTVADGDNFYKVFVDHSENPTTQGSLSLEYNAMFIGDSCGDKKARLYTPVLTVSEVEQTVGTFTYANGIITFHAFDNKLADKYFVPHDSNDYGVFLDTLQDVHLEDVRIVGCYRDCLRCNHCSNVELVACEVGLSAKGMAYALDNCNVTAVNCAAFGASVDGFNLHDYGESVFTNCTSYYNGDDGLSHHQGCNGTIIGGEYAYNGAGGITPAFGAIVNMHDVYIHHNLVGIQYVGATGYPEREHTVFHAVSVNNTDKDIHVDRNSVILAGCVYGTKELGIRGALTEYNSKIVGATVTN